MFFGLGKETTIEWIRIRWPSGIEQVLRHPPSDQILRVNEEFPASSVQEGTAIPADAPWGQAGAVSTNQWPHLREAALQARPDAMRFFQDGLTLAEQGKLDQAVEKLRAATTLRPQFVDAYFAMGVVLQQQGRDQAPAAVDAFLKVLELKPDHIGAHLNLSSALAATGDSEAAAACRLRDDRLRGGEDGAGKNLAAVV